MCANLQNPHFQKAPPGFPPGCTEAPYRIRLTLSLNRSIPVYQEMLLKDIQGNWSASIGGYIPRISGKTMGIAGLGRIGTAMAMRARVPGHLDMVPDQYRIKFADCIRQSAFILGLVQNNLHSGSDNALLNIRFRLQDLGESEPLWQ